MSNRVDTFSGSTCVRVGYQLDPNFFCRAVTEGDHLAELPPSIDMHQRKWDPAGKKAFCARRSITEESLPIEYSMTGFAAVAATSRMISIDSDSSSKE